MFFNFVRIHRYPENTDHGIRDGLTTAQSVADLIINSTDIIEAGASLVPGSRFSILDAKSSIFWFDLASFFSDLALFLALFVENLFET